MMQNSRCRQEDCEAGVPRVGDGKTVDSQLVSQPRNYFLGDFGGFDNCSTTGEEEHPSSVCAK